MENGKFKTCVEDIAARESIATGSTGNLFTPEPTVRGVTRSK